MERTVLTDVSQVDEWFQTLPRCASLDTETTSLNYYQMDVLGVSLCDGSRVTYIDLSNSKTEADRLIERLRSYLPVIPKLIFHNAAFDLKVLHKLGIATTEDVFCTMVASHLLDEEGPCGLKDLAEKYLGVETVSWESASSSGTTSSTFYTYAQNDALWTWQLHELFLPRLRDESLDELFFNVEMPFQFILRDMEINGLLVDKEQLLHVRDSLRDKVSSLYLDVLHAGHITYSVQMNMFQQPEIIPAVNLDSPVQLVKCLQNMGITLTEKTDSGAFSVDKHVLESLKHHPFCAALLEYRAASKLLNSYLEKLPGMIDPDGRVRPWFNGCGTVTGRLSSDMQQLPKKRKGDVDIRSLFIAPPGKAFICADYAGQELRVLAHESKDLTMIDAFFAGKDLHLAIANKSYKLGLPDAVLYEAHPKHNEIRATHKGARDRAKTVSFGLAYGKSAYGFALDWGISEKEALDFIEEFYAEFPRVREAIERSNQEVCVQGYVRNLVGRKRRFKVTGNKYSNQRAFRQAFNFKIQGASCDMLRLACNLIRRNLEPSWNAKFVLLVHDEIVLEVDEEFIELATTIVSKCMCRAMELCVPLRADVSVGRNYGDCK